VGSGGVTSKPASGEVPEGVHRHAALDRIRRRVLTEGLSKRQACREYGLHWHALTKILEHPKPPGYRRAGPRRKPKLEPFLPIIHEILKQDRNAPREVRLYANLVDPARFADGQLLPIFESVEMLGSGEEVVHTPDIPRYGEMARYLFERLGWDARQIELYRLRLQFPPMPSAVMVSHSLHPALGRTRRKPKPRARRGGTEES
jgi:hypothetical protein